MKRFVKVLLQAPGAASLALFTREIWANPRAMGAACPSGPALAACMASRVPADRDGLVVELGGGTGAVTAALLKHGVPPWKLVVVERSPTLVHHLRQRDHRIAHVVPAAARNEGNDGARNSQDGLRRDTCWTADFRSLGSDCSVSATWGERSGLAHACAPAAARAGLLPPARRLDGAMARGCSWRRCTMAT